MLTGGLVLAFWSISAVAQLSDTRPSVICGPTQVDQLTCSPDDPAVMRTAVATEARPVRPTLELTAPITKSDFLRYQPLLLAAIDERLGARYSWGAEGPNAFDCSGFVWSIFHSIGIDFERVSARTLWVRFSPATPEEQYRFGTLVFFSDLAHVGVVADEQGFYHASRRKGVIYSPFNEYWLKRIDGFRKVPLPEAIIAE